MQNFDSPYTTSVCNYFDESPNIIKSNYQISKINQINLNTYFNEYDSLAKEESQNLKFNSSQMKNIKPQLNLNTNSQSHSIKNYNTSSMSFQYSDSEKKSEYSKRIIKIRKEKKNKKKNHFVIEKNENLEIITSNRDYQVSQCISNNNIFSAFSIEINPKKKKENSLPKNNNLKIENISKNINDINYMNKDSDIKFNNGFRLVPLSIIEEKFSTPSNNKKNKNKDNSPKNHFLKNYGKTVERQDKIFNFMKNNFTKTNNNDNNNQIKKIIEKDNNNNNQNNSKGKKKYIVKSKNNSKQKDEIKIKPNSNNDINDIIQRHFQQKNITKFISKSKKENNSIDDKKNNHKVISYTFFQNNYPKKNISPQITNNLLKEKNNKTHNYSSSGKNYINKNLNNTDDSNIKTKQEINLIHQNKRQKIKTYINLSSILNKFYSKSVKKTNNKSLGVFTEILSNNNFLNDTKNNIDDNVRKNLFKITFEKNDNKINKNNSIKIPEKKNNIKEISNSNNNSYLSKIIHTQETVNSSKENNNYINTTTNLSPNRKSPQVINDFSFYKRKMNYKGHFISLVSPKENNKTYGNTYINRNNINDINFLDNNICNSEYKVHPNRKPIASIKLMKLEGDIDSNISRDSDL